MSKELKELMQISIIGEDENLSNMIEDIIPSKQQRFTDLELEASKKETFSIVVYKKENPMIRFFKGLKLSLERMRIIKKSREFEYVRNQNK